MQKQSLFHRNQSRLRKMKESIGVSVCVLVVMFFLSHTPPMFLKLFHECMPVNMSSPLSRTQEPRQDGNDKFQKRRSKLFQTETFQEGTIFWKGNFLFHPDLELWGSDWMILKSFLPLIFQPFVNMNLQRRPKSLIPPEEVWATYTLTVWLDLDLTIQFNNNIIRCHTLSSRC